MKWKKIDSLILLVFIMGILFGKFALEDIDLQNYPLLNDWTWRMLIATGIIILIYELREHFEKEVKKPR